MDLDYKDKLFTLKDLITLIIFISTIMAIYYNTASKIDALEVELLRQKDLIEENDPKILNTEIQYIRRDLDKLDVKIDRILDKVINDGK